MKIMKHYILAIIFLLFGLVACTEDLPGRGDSPVMPENTQGVFFPAINKPAVEIEPADPKEMTIIIARKKTTDAITVPIKVSVNDNNVFEVPATVAFAAGEDTVQFIVTFPNADEGITYNLSLMVEGDDFVNQYGIDNFYLSTSLTRILWTEQEDFVYLDGTFLALFTLSPTPMYVKTEKAVLGGGIVRYRFKNAYRVPTAGADADGIYDGFSYNEPGDYDEDNDYYVVVEIAGNGDVSMARAAIGVDWGYGMVSIGSIYGNLSTNITAYPLGTFEGDVITFPANSLFFSMANFQGGGVYPSGTPTFIYFGKEAYIAANMKIEDFNTLEYEEIIGAVSEFESKTYGESWNQSFAKAIDIDEENIDSEYKNLYYLADLYAADFGLAFYYNGREITIPANQPIGRSVFNRDVFVSQNNTVVSGVATTNKGVTVYTLGLIFHFEDGTVLGNFTETFYFSEDPVSYEITDFYGRYNLTAPSQFGESEPAANMNVTIAAGTAENTFVITGIDWAEAVEATFDVTTSTLSIEPQTLPDYTYQGVPRDMTLYTTDIDGVSTTAVMDFSFNMSGKLVMTSTSEADGYLIRSEGLGGWVDGYYDLVFSPIAAGSAPAKAQAAKSLSVKKSNITTDRNAEKCSKDNFIIQPKTSKKVAVKNFNATMVF